MPSLVITQELALPLGLEQAWALLADFSSWGAWNPFVTAIRGATGPQLGARIELELRWPDDRRERAREEITQVFEGPARRSFTWCLRGPLDRLGLLQATRELSLEALSPTCTHYRSVERFEGVLVPLLPTARIRDALERMAAGFAGACARQGRGEQPAQRSSSSPPARGCPFSRLLGGRPKPSRGSLAQLDTPPMVSGARPLLGHMLEFRGAHRALFERGAREHGAVFGVALGPWRCAVVSGPEASARFYGRTDHELRTDKPYAYLRAMFGRVGLTHTPEGYVAERHILLAPFKAKLTASRLEIIDAELHTFVEGLGEQGEFELVSTFQTLLQRISAHMLMGPALCEAIGDDFWACYGDLAEGLDQVLPPWLPLPRFIRRDRAKADLHRQLAPLIAERRALIDDPRRPQDMLQTLAESRGPDGQMLPAERVIEYVLALIFAGFETTTGHAAWALIHVLQHGQIHGRLRAHVDAQLRPGQGIDRDTIAQLGPLRDAIRETERLMPVADRHVRMAVEDIELGGSRVPRGWLVMSAVALSHRDPARFREPDRYDPGRFARGEGQGKLALIGFGGGRHRCTGVKLAYNEMVMLLARMLEAFELELIGPRDPAVADTTGVLVPEPTRIRYRRRA